MMLTCCQSVSQRLRQTQSVRQTLKCSQAQLQSHLLGLRLDLIEALRQERYEPKATCPGCGRKMTALEILRGFNQDPRDFTTECTGCHTRFQPLLICFGKDGASRIELPFYCDAQTLDQLRGLERLNPEELSFQHPAVYRSAIVHHGGVVQAFAKIGITYPHEGISDWRAKVTPFLGRMHDSVIADLASVSVHQVFELRSKLKINRYTKAVAAREITRAKKAKGKKAT